MHKEDFQIIKFTVTHPLGMHARVCSKWVKIINKLNMSNDDSILIKYKNKKIPANSLFALLEERIPQNAEIDLLINKNFSGLIDNSTLEELRFIISKESFIHTI